MQKRGGEGMWMVVCGWDAAPLLLSLGASSVEQWRGRCARARERVSESYIACVSAHVFAVLQFIQQACKCYDSRCRGVLLYAHAL